MPVQENFTEKFKVARNYVIIRQFYGKKPSDLQRDLKISKANTSNWENGIANPGPNFVDQMSNYFGLPREVFYMDDLTTEYLKVMKNNTDEESEPAIPEKTTGDVEFFQRVVRIGSTEYVVLPKTVLDGEYRIASTRDADKNDRYFNKIDESTEKALTAKNEVIQMKDELIKDRDQKIRERDEIIRSLQERLAAADQKA